MNLSAYAGKHKHLLSRKRKWILIFLLASFHCFSSGVYSQGHPAIDDEFVGPFPSWINVKTQFGAVGDGVADETAVLQAAFDAVGNSTSTASVVYLPPGTYRITATLRMDFKTSVSLIGADPATTKIKWAGPAGGTMLSVSGTSYSRFNRITWDGAGRDTALNAIDQSYDGSNGYFDTGNEYADNVFTDVSHGIRGGFLGHGFAETAIMRCKFIRNKIAGVSLGNFNALDAWIWHCSFQDCNIGVTNFYGAGNFDVYNCVFKNSAYYDIVMTNTGRFSVRDNTSIGSEGFFAANFTRNPALITLQSNTILDSRRDATIYLGNHGPVALIDNVVRSRVNAAAPIVWVNQHETENDLFCTGNTFTVSNPVQSASRMIIEEKSVASRELLGGLKEQVLPGTQPNLNRQVFEVPPGSDAAAIQAIINQANTFSGNRPVVHFPHGTYYINTTLNIPKGSDIQLVGDGHGDTYRTELQWVGTTAGPVIDIVGVSKATLRDFTVNGNNLATNIRMSDIDQEGSRVFMHETEANVNQTNLLVDGLDNTLVLAINSRFSRSTGKSIDVVGGPFAAAGTPLKGRTILQGGLEFDNNPSQKITNGGNLLLRDVWYESNIHTPYLHLTGSGTFAIENSRIASLRGRAPVIDISNFAGKATFLNAHIEDRISINGNGAQTKFLGLGTVSYGQTYIENTTSPAGDIRSYNSRSVVNADAGTGSKEMANIGQVDVKFISSMLEPGRNVHSEVLAPLPAGVTDVRLYRVWTHFGVKGIDLQRSSGVDPQANTLLSNLTVSTGTLSPNFASATTTYSVAVANSIASIRVTATAAYPVPTTILINDTIETSGTASRPIMLSPGENKITVVINGPGLKTSTYTITVVKAVNKEPILNKQTFAINENTANDVLVGAIAASDDDPDQTLIYTITAGNTGSAFVVSGNELRVAASALLDFETNPVFTLTVQVTDNGAPSKSISANVIVNLNDLNDNPPVIISNGGGSTAAVSLPENSTTVTTVKASDADAGAKVVYSLSGPDASRFTIDPQTGELAFKTAPDFESPLDAGANNVYEVTVVANDGLNMDQQLFTITVLDVFEAPANRPPVITSGGGSATLNISLAENILAVTTIVATDPDAGAVISYTRSGTDAGRFTLNASTGVLAFATVPNFEKPEDAGLDNVYNLVVIASDGKGGTDEQAITVTITDSKEPPVIKSNGGSASATILVAENTTAVTTVMAVDEDANAVVTYRKAGGADAAKFNLDPSSGVLTFILPPDFEKPADIGADNIYNVVVRASDETGAIDDQAITITITNINENPVIGSNGGGANASLSIAENTVALTTVTATDVDAGSKITYSKSAGDDQDKFTIDGTTGLLKFTIAPDFDQPSDVGGNNVYEVVVRATDQLGLWDDQKISVGVSNINEPPVITSDLGGNTALVKVNENTTAVTTAIAVDPDAGSKIVYSLKNAGDASKFTLNVNTGLLVFKTAPDYEKPADVEKDNNYEVTVRATDGSFTDEQLITVAIMNVNDNAPVITSNGGGGSAVIRMSGNLTTVTTVTATDEDAGTMLTFTKAGGDNADKFKFDPFTGVLEFIKAPNAGNHQGNGNNVYRVLVRVSDGPKNAEQALTIIVTDAPGQAINHPPVIVSSGGSATATLLVPENGVLVTTVLATDPDDDAIITYAKAGGADASKFNIDPATGVLTFIAAPDFENPADNNRDNVYEVNIKASDGLDGVDHQSLMIKVTDVNEAILKTHVSPYVYQKPGYPANISMAADQQALAFARYPFQATKQTGDVYASVPGRLHLLSPSNNMTKANRYR
ncbi:hypothetical protein EXU57_22870 [Segetibacter sp. 3557_3]|uniref:cadherin domain-containing protein n=1 Tax=Segetibacter sp. 3557_3 TaxID=2547429 RepID=UPI001059096D|nr:cadherin domain-containing protein [Segetibacter sp. 3557_3]TDH19745.1 hypothetical protein EXU57_22870 [Segetibacter sp. 3557_3]